MEHRPFLCEHECPCTTLAHRYARGLMSAIRNWVKHGILNGECWNVGVSIVSDVKRTSSTLSMMYPRKSMARLGLCGHSSHSSLTTADAIRAILWPSDTADSGMSWYQSSFHNVQVKHIVLKHWVRTGWWRTLVVTSSEKGLGGRQGARKSSLR